MPINLRSSAQLQPLGVQRRQIPFDTLVNALSYNPTATAIEAGGNLIANVLRRKRELRNQVEQRRQFENLAGLETNSLGTGEGSLPMETAYNLIKLKQQKEIENQKLAQKQEFNNLYRNFLDLKQDKSKDSTNQIIQIRKQLIDQKINTFDPTELSSLQNSIDTIDNELSNRNILPSYKPNPSPRQQTIDSLGILQ